MLWSEETKTLNLILWRYLWCQSAESFVNNLFFWFVLLSVFLSATFVSSLLLFSICSCVSQSLGVPPCVGSKPPMARSRISLGSVCAVGLATAGGLSHCKEDGASVYVWEERENRRLRETLHGLGKGGLVRQKEKCAAAKAQQIMLEWEAGTGGVDWNDTVTSQSQLWLYPETFVDSHS